MKTQKIINIEESNNLLRSLELSFINFNEDNNINFENIFEYYKNTFLEFGITEKGLEYFLIEFLNNEDEDDRKEFFERFINNHNSKILNKLVVKKEKPLITKYIVHHNIDKEYAYQYVNKFTLVALLEENYLKIGLSFCDDRDNYVKKFGVKQAETRAKVSNWSIPVLSTNPQKVRNNLYDLIEIIDNNINLYKQIKWIENLNDYHNVGLI